MLQPLERRLRRKQGRSHPTHGRSLNQRLHPSLVAWDPLAVALMHNRRRINHSTSGQRLLFPRLWGTALARPIRALTERGLPTRMRIIRKSPRTPEWVPWALEAVFGVRTKSERPLCGVRMTYED